MTDLGTIPNGINNFKVTGKLNSVPGLLQVQEPNGQWMNGIFTKNATDKEVQLTISQSYDQEVASRMTKEQDAMSNTIALRIDNNNDLASLTGGTFNPVPDSQKNNSWSAECGIVAGGGGYLSCKIYTSIFPFKLYGGVLGLPSAGYYWGTFRSNLNSRVLLDYFWANRQRCIRFGTIGGQAPFYLGFNSDRSQLFIFRFDGGGPAFAIPFALLADLGWRNCN